MPSLASAAPAGAVQPSPTPSTSHHFDDANPRNPARHIHWGAEEVYEDDTGLEGAESEGQGGLEAEEGQLSDGVVLAITAAKGKVACCCLDPASDKIYFLQDQNDSSAWDLTALGAKTAERHPAEHYANLPPSAVLEQLTPEIVLTCATADPAFMETVEEKLSTLASDSSAASSLGPDGSPVRIEYRPNRDFYAGSGKNALYRVHITEGGWYAPAEAEFDHDVGSTYDHPEDCNDFALGDAYDFGRPLTKGRKVAHDQNDGDRERRNHELRIETFLTSLNACPLTARSTIV